MQYLIILTTFFLCLPIVSALSFDTFEVMHSLDGYTCSRSIKLFYDTDTCRSKMECISSCANSPACHGVLYSPGLQICRGCIKNDQRGLNSPNIITGSRLTEFHLRKKSSTHGQPCNNPSDCDTNQYCGTDGVCMCTPGFGYSLTMDTCNMNCLQYGVTFEEHPMEKINVKELHTESYLTHEECLKVCVDQPRCRAADYNTGNLKCHIHEATAITARSSFQDSASVTHCHRNCI